jgi:hypothetical protein
VSDDSTRDILLSRVSSASVEFEMSLAPSLGENFVFGNILELATSER